jgi:hypothetical protein
MTPRKKPVPKPEPEQDDGEQRTEIEVEYHGVRGNAKIGRGGSALLWAVAWAIAVISTLIGLGMVVSLLEKIGAIGCLFSVSLYLTSCYLAFSSRFPFQ